jgi:BirA family transcriptional regulator, biotin operon repressor / biotin---[acetyl-CoA-carboxylase] ligase
MRSRQLFGNDNRHFPVLDSTNREAWRMLKEGTAKEGTIVVADFQSHGRGQGDSRWESEHGKNLCASAILKPSFLAPDQQFYLNKVIALAVAEAVRRCLPGRRVLIKWPNDIYVEDEKIAGILIENAIIGSRLSHSIAGIGINVNQLRFDPEIPNAISMAKLIGRTVDLQLCLDSLCIALDHWYDRLATKQTRAIDKAYLEVLLGLGERRPFHRRGERFYAIIAGLNQQGLLVLQMDNGTQESFDMKEVGFLFD